MEEEYFRSRFKQNKSRDAFWKIFAQWLNQRFISKEDVVLDLGAGYGNFINNIVCREKHALDQSTVLKKSANKEVLVHIQQPTKMGTLKKNHFDIVFASNFFEHLSDDELKATFKIIKQVLKKNGKLIILQPNYKYSYKHYFDDYTHKKAFSDESMSDFLSTEGFKVVYKKAKFLPFSFKSRLPKPKFLIKLYLQLPFKPFAKQMFFVAEKISKGGR